MRAQALLHLYKRGAASVAMVCEDDGGYYLAGLCRYSQAYAHELLELRYNRTLATLADGNADLEALRRALLQAHATRADVLVLVLQPEAFRFALATLKAARPPDGDAGGHVYRAVWWNGVAEPAAQAQGSSGGTDCDGLGDECEYVVGAAQMSVADTASGYVDPLVEMTWGERQLVGKSGCGGAP